MTASVFISHVASESEIAVWIKNKIGGLFQGSVEFFVSSDGNDIVGGDRWLDKIEAALKESHTVLVLCSDGSVRQPWVNFEAGGAWMAGKRVIPLCHGGMDPGKLPQPLAALQAYSLCDQRDLYQLVSLLAKSAGVEPPEFDAHALVHTLPAPVRESANAPSLGSGGNKRPHAQRDITSARSQSVDRSEYEFDKRTGIYRHKVTREAVCTNCLLEGRVSPLSESPDGWRCHFNKCRRFYSNPDFQPPEVETVDWNPLY